MLDFIAKYWLTFLFGIIAAGLTYACKKIWSLYRSEQAHQKNKEQEEFYKDIKATIEDSYSQTRENDKLLQQQIDNTRDELKNVKTGLLSVQGRNFRNQCYGLLERGHEITVEEYEQFEEDYAAYKALGGNHRGDTLHASVVEKFNTQITK